MIIGFKYAEKYLTALGLEVFKTYSDDDAQTYLTPQSFAIWKQVKSLTPQFHDILNTSGHLMTYCIQHGSTLSLSSRKINFDSNKSLKHLSESLIRYEYLSPNLFDISYLEILINNNSESFNKDFIQIVMNEHNLLYDSLLKNWKGEFTKNAVLFSKAIEQIVCLLNRTQGMIYDAVNKTNQEDNLQQTKDYVSVYIEQELSTLKLIQ